jgi:DNA-binding HxlR family transcriptional regulator/peroxiredoxin
VKYTALDDADCAIAQALGVVGDWWSLLVIRDVAGGLHRFDGLQRELGVSRKVLAERLAKLVGAGVLEKRAYSKRPPRFEYHLTDRGHGLLPVLIALQDWGTRHLQGDGSLTGTSTPGSAESRRVSGLIGQRLPVERMTGHDGALHDPVGDSPWTVLYCFPGAAPPGERFYPPGWGDIPGAAGCALESITYRERHAELLAAGVTVRGASTQRPDQLAGFAEHAGLPFVLLSDAELVLGGALRLPTFRAGGVDRLKRLTLVLDAKRTIRHVQFPITDPAGSVDEALTIVQSSAGRGDDPRRLASQPG